MDKTEELSKVIYDLNQFLSGKKILTQSYTESLINESKNRLQNILNASRQFYVDKYYNSETEEYQYNVMMNESNLDNLIAEFKSDSSLNPEMVSHILCDYLNGRITDPEESYYYYMNHPKYDVIKKVEATVGGIDYNNPLSKKELKEQLRNNCEINKHSFLLNEDCSFILNDYCLMNSIVNECYYNELWVHDCMELAQKVADLLGDINDYPDWDELFKTVKNSIITMNQGEGYNICLNDKSKNVDNSTLTLQLIQFVFINMGLKSIRAYFNIETLINKVIKNIKPLITSEDTLESLDEVLEEEIQFVDSNEVGLNLKHNYDKYTTLSFKHYTIDEVKSMIFERLK